MLIIKDGKLVNVTKSSAIFGERSEQPYDIAAVSSETLPSGCPIMTTIFVVDKIGVAFSDGQDNWYRESDKPVAAGQPISALF